MHVLWLFFAWPSGGIWSNVLAMPACGLAAVVFAFVFRDHIGVALRSWWRRHLSHAGELAEIRARLDGHADLLDLNTPGGLAAVMAEVRQTRDAAESALAGVQQLAAVTARQAPRRGATEMRKTATPQDKEAGQ